jgi:hypothetical protein
MVQGIPQDIAALPGRLRQHFGNGPLETWVIIRDRKLNAAPPPA